MTHLDKPGLLAAAVTAVTAKVTLMTASDTAQYAVAFSAICTGGAMLCRGLYYLRKTSHENHEKQNR